MTEARLASSVQVSALIRLAEIGGDFATVLRKGDPTAGSLLLIGLIRGQNPVIFERFPSSRDISSWQRLATNEAQDEATIAGHWKKRVAQDPDLWVVELDVASAERLNGLLDQTT